MQLPVLKEVKYISPSSLMEMEDCDYRFYLKRMTDMAWPDSVQGQAAAIGSAFDAFVKAYLAEHLGLAGDPKNQIENLINSSVDEYNRATAVPMGKILFEEYKRTKMLQRLIDEGLTGIEMTEKKDLVIGDDLVPVLGKPDAALADGTIVDWKVQGSASKSGASPTPGYCYGRRGFDTLPAHKRDGEPLENLNERWALQMAIYSWLYTGIAPFRDIPVAIENVSVRSGKYTFTSIRTHVTAEFQIKIWQRLVYAWHKAQSGEINDPSPSPRRCFPYNCQCEVSDRCEAFQRWQNGAAEGVDEIDKLMGR